MPFKIVTRFFMLLAATLANSAGAETFPFQFAETPLKISSKVPIVRYRMLETTGKPGETMHRLPLHLISPHFAMLALGPTDTPQGATNINIVVDETDGKPPRLWIDANGDGNFSDDAPVTWEPFAYTLNSGATQTEYRGKFKVQIRYADTTVPADIVLDWLDPQDVRRSGNKAPLLYTLNPSRSGTISLGGVAYPALLVDTNALGDYHLKPGAKASGILLCMDINANGQIDKFGEAYDIAQPFTIKGITYQVTQVDVTGQSLTLEKSAKPVPEILPPPDLRPGQSIPPFTAETIQGKKVAFPADFKGKPVILVFWASWCGDCQEEIPHLLAAYTKYHAQGLEVLGVSLDNPDSKDKLVAFMQANKIFWPQIYDGKTWRGPIADQYKLDWVPTLLLVDGTTGKILADNETLIGTQIEKTLESKTRLK